MSTTWPSSGAPAGPLPATTPSHATEMQGSHISGADGYSRWSRVVLFLLLMLLLLLRLLLRCCCCGSSRRVAVSALFVRLQS